MELQFACRAAEDNVSFQSKNELGAMSAKAQLCLIFMLISATVMGRSSLL